MLIDSIFNHTKLNWQNVLKDKNSLSSLIKMNKPKTDRIWIESNQNIYGFYMVSNFYIQNTKKPKQTIIQIKQFYFSYITFIPVSFYVLRWWCFKGIFNPTPFFTLKWNKNEYRITNATTQFYISFYFEVYSIKT